MSYSSSYGQGSSSGSSNIPDYAQSPFLMQLAQHAQQYADQAYGRYDSTYQPLENSLISDSQKFQDPKYLATVGGQASSGAAQAGEAQRTNTLRDLEAFGVDPSSGRYAELDQAERGRTAATQAGASQTAMRATQQAGRDMRGQALAIGQKNLDRASHNLDTASSLKYPPLGHQQQAQNTQSSSSAPASRSDNSSGSRGGGSQGDTRGGGFGPQTGTSGGQHVGNPENNDLTTARGVGGGMSKIITAPGDGPKDPPTDPPPQGQPGDWGPGVGDPNNPNSLIPGYDPQQQSGLSQQGPSEGDPNYNPFQTDNQNPWNDPAGGQAPLDNSGYDPNASWGGVNDTPTQGDNPFDTGGDQNSSDNSAYDPSLSGQGYLDNSGDTSGWGPTQDQSAAGDYSGDSGGNQNYLDNSGDTSGWGPTQDQSGYDSGGDYAQGGAINGQAGGAIPTGDSPSAGQQTDDVRINANAGEFMIPKDVAAWKGQEFFQKLIAQSRKARVTAPAHGTNNPAEAQQQGQMQNQAMGQ